MSKKKTDLIVIISRGFNLLDFSSTLNCVRLHIFGSLEFVNFWSFYDTGMRITKNFGNSHLHLKLQLSKIGLIFKFSNESNRCIITNFIFILVTKKVDF